jgi:electron-transferring-flavoprotein dehydrogenase
MSDTEQNAVERQMMEVDIACVGFGPAMGGFLTTLSRALLNEDGTPAVESKTAPGMPPQVICYERADDLGFGVSGMVTRACGIRATFPDLDVAQIPMAASVTNEKVVYLLDPHSASRRPFAMRAADSCIRALPRLFKLKHDAVELPWSPNFLHKAGGFVMSLGQFNQWVGAQLMGSGTVQIWPATPVSEALIQADRVAGVRLMDQGVLRDGTPDACYMPGMDVHAALTVVGDGPVGAVGQQLDEHFGMPPSHSKHEWAVGMKMVVQLRADSGLEPGTVLHTIGYPEPEIFGFLYVLPDNVATLGIFVPSWFDSPTRTAYRYLQHFMMHPYLWRYLEGGTLRSWGAKSLLESGKRGEPWLAGDGYARIGEGSGSTNVLTGSGVDEAWTSGVQLAEGVIELLKAGKPFTKENLGGQYVARRRQSWLEREATIAEKARDGFHSGVVKGFIGMVLAGLTNGKMSLQGKPKKIPQSLEQFYGASLSRQELTSVRERCARTGDALHDELMRAAGWPDIPLDGQLLVSHQDALLMGGKVQATAGYADHVTFGDRTLCAQCAERLCIEMCSGQAIRGGDDGLPSFDREKCVHCGACMWNCTMPVASGRTNVVFKAGVGGLHSSEN